MTPSTIKRIPIIIAIYTGCAIENAASAIATIPNIKESIDEKTNPLLIPDISPVIPKIIIMNPTR